LARGLRPIPGRLTLWKVALATIVFLVVDFAIVHLFDEELSDARRPTRAATAVVQPCLACGVPTAEHIRFGQVLSELQARLGAVEVACDPQFPERFDRQFQEAEERLKGLEDQLGQLRSGMGKSQPERRVEGLHPDELPESVSLILQGLFGGGSTDFQGIGFHIWKTGCHNPKPSRAAHRNRWAYRRKRLRGIQFRAIGAPSQSCSRLSHASLRFS
jgi:hypothetical protein